MKREARRKTAAEFHAGRNCLRRRGGLLKSISRRYDPNGITLFAGEVVHFERLPFFHRVQIVAHLSRLTKKAPKSGDFRAQKITNTFSFQHHTTLHSVPSGIMIIMKKKIQPDKGRNKKTSQFRPAILFFVIPRSAAYSLLSVRESLRPGWSLSPGPSV